MPSRVSTKEWLAYIAIMALVDVIQFFIGLFGVALLEIAIGAAIVAVNEAADPFIGIGIAGYLQGLRKVNMINKPKRLISLLGVTLVEEATGGIAPFWFLDIWYIWSDVRKEDAQIMAAQSANSANAAKGAIYLNQGGSRKPALTQGTGTSNPDGRSQTRTVNLAPLNQGGVRAAIQGSNPTTTSYGQSGSNTGTSGKRPIMKDIKEETSQVISERG